ncbi:MAG: helix-turn-helix domain-containing protein [Clostridia bacterium]|nr:helix-turn-helix domain-containing protein [Clostridia bacterium]
MGIGYNIQFYRKKAGLSQEDLARMLFVSRQTISLWEKGQTVPTVDNLLRLREIFGVSADKILVGEENMELIPETEDEDGEEVESVPDEAGPAPEKQKSPHLLRAILLLVAGLLCGTCCILLSFLPIHTGFFVGCVAGVLGTVGLTLLIASALITRRITANGKRRAMSFSYPAVAALLCGVALFCVMIPKTPLDRLSAKLSISLPEAVGVSTDASRVKLERMTVNTRTEVYYSDENASELTESLKSAEEWMTRNELGLELEGFFASFDFLAGGDTFCLFNLSDSEKNTTLKAGDEYLAAAYFADEGMLRIAELILS